jgi:hypothetical protein
MIWRVAEQISKLSAAFALMPWGWSAGVATLARFLGDQGGGARVVLHQHLHGLVGLAADSGFKNGYMLGVHVARAETLPCSHLSEAVSLVRQVCAKIEQPA